MPGAVRGRWVDVGVWMARIEDAVKRKSRAEKRHVSRRSRAEVRGLVRAEQQAKGKNQLQ